MRETHIKIKNLLLQTHSIDVSSYDIGFLENSIQKRMIETESLSKEDYYFFLTKNNKERLQFLDSLQNSYSEFFRNSLSFSVLERIILPSLLLRTKENKRKEIRIWSAACADGQEAYSLAILLEELKNGDSEKYKYRIFATDQSELQLASAIKGQYKKPALNNMTLKRINSCFIKQNATYSIKPELKANIDFSEFDLFNKEFSSPPVSIFGDFDLVICANLLFYYKPEFRQIILEKTINSLAIGGFLMTGEAEREILMNNNCHEVYPQSAIFQKNS